MVQSSGTPGRETSSGGVLIILQRNSFKGHIKFQEVCPGRALMAHIHTDAGDLQIVGVYAQANNDEDTTQPVSSLRAQLWDKIAEAVGPASNVLTIMAGDFNMTELKEHAYRDNVPAGGLSAAEKRSFDALKAKAGLHALTQDVPTYRHPGGSSVLDRVYMNMHVAWQQTCDLFL